MTHPPNPQPATVPEPGVNPLRTASDWRDLMHRAIAAVLVALGTVQVAVDDPRALIVTVVVPGVLGILDAAISFANSNDGGRRIVYATLGLGQAVVQFVGYTADSLPVVLVGIAAAVVNSVYASQYTPTSPVSAILPPRAG